MKWRTIRIFLDLILIIIVVFISIESNKNVNAISENIHEHPIYSVDMKEKAISLTFDINWAEKDNIQSILQILNKYNIKGTFFIMGGWVDYSSENVEKLKAIKEGGHEIGNHSYKHPDFVKISESKIEEQLKKTDETIENNIGERTKLFRFPSGSYNKQAIQKVKSLGYIPIQWNVDSVDWKEVGEESEYNRVMKGVAPGAILLFHNNAKYTPKNLEKIITELKTQGYEFKTVGNLIYSDEYYIDENGIQHKNK
ncbi:deacetylase [Clostridium botulinum]|uniref:polysaccharide deacetylase family protein n=1 Tax=Clostridium botulinum TaxID=1491 RepID=UPI000174EB20|nr:polysaccharide deacetylase family protein [Clostridium botulinum]ACD53656.1 chitooligosaccharide deacetylase [Clostridium botulinum E3 str. Alaska E43]AJF30133.1 deacetylase [Clostridium botulinum]AJF33196.1 deacetylase [Clostridium botulinum]MBY6788671.1 polysaccharide deacetylase family protein [Clostridium botulinum]MBY6816327.1 polysaccharide deacetylase family protein [Clostridium botulinum]